MAYTHGIRRVGVPFLTRMKSAPKSKNWAGTLGLLLPAVLYPNEVLGRDRKKDRAGQLKAQSGRAKGQYPYVASDRGEFIRRSMEWKRGLFAKGKKFIDVGCGIGDKTILMSVISKMECWGLEYDYGNLALGNHAAKSLEGYETETFGEYLEKRRIHFVCANALEYEGFGNFDRIFTYCPMTGNMREKFYIHIMKQLKPGTIWWEYSDWHPSLLGLEDEKELGEYGEVFPKGRGCQGASILVVK